MTRPLCVACKREIPMQNEEPPYIDAWQASVFIAGREYRYHQVCYDRAFDGAQGVLFT